MPFSVCVWAEYWMASFEMMFQEQNSTTWSQRKLTGNDNTQRQGFSVHDVGTKRTREEKNRKFPFYCVECENRFRFNQNHLRIAWNYLDFC